MMYVIIMLISMLAQLTRARSCACCTPSHSSRKNVYTMYCTVYTTYIQYYDKNVIDLNEFESMEHLVIFSFEGIIGVPNFLQLMMRSYSRFHVECTFRSRSDLSIINAESGTLKLARYI